MNLPKNLDKKLKIVKLKYMEGDLEISEKELERRRKISEARKKAIKEKRRKGYRAYVIKRRRERRKAETLARREKEKEKKRQERERRKALKKPGRKKKRGRPKMIYKKVVVKKTRALPEYIYKIVSCKNGSQNKFIGKYRTSVEAYEVFNELKKASEKVVFPAVVTGKHVMKNSVDEYLLIKKGENTANNGLRNEYGKIVEQRTNIEGWFVLDKFRYQREETFWVFGYDSRTDRKTFSWIYDLLLNSVSSLSYIRVMVYKNKLVFKYDSRPIDVVFCKNESDCVRLYNKLEEAIKKEKIKQIIFIGDQGSTKLKREKVERELADLTGWAEKKIKMNTTTYYLKG